MTSIEQYQQLLERNFSRAFEVLASSTSNMIHFGCTAYDGAAITVTKTLEQITAELEAAANPVKRSKRSTESAEESQDE